MTTSQNGIELIKKFEGLRLTAYPDAGGYSIGYGHHSSSVNPNQAITQTQAEQLLTEDLRRFEDTVGRLNSSLSQNQFDALVSLTYNIGTGALNSSNVARIVRDNPSPTAQLEKEWKEWGAKQGLTNRRAAEWELYTQGTSKPASHKALFIILTILAVAILTASIVTLTKKQ